MVHLWKYFARHVSCDNFMKYLYLATINKKKCYVHICVENLHIITDSKTYLHIQSSKT